MCVCVSTKIIWEYRLAKIGPKGQSRASKWKMSIVNDNWQKLTQRLDVEISDKWLQTYPIPQALPYKIYLNISGTMSDVSIKTTTSIPFSTCHILCHTEHQNRNASHCSCLSVHKWVISPSHSKNMLVLVKIAILLSLSFLVRVSAWLNMWLFRPPSVRPSVPVSYIVVAQRSS